MTRIFIFFLLLVACSSGTYAGWHSDQDSTRSKKKRKITSIHTTRPNAVDKEYKSILIVGSGAVTTRQVVEKLSLRLNEHYTKLGITCNFEFIGNKRETRQARLEAALKKYTPDAVLLIAEDPDYDQRMGLVGPQYPIIPNLSERQGRVTAERTFLDSKLQLSLLEQDIILPIWEAEFYIAGDVTRDAMFKQMFTLLTDELKANKLP